METHLAGLRCFICNGPSQGTLGEQVRLTRTTALSVDPDQQLCCDVCYGSGGQNHSIQCEALTEFEPLARRFVERNQLELLGFRSSGLHSPPAALPAPEQPPTEAPQPPPAFPLLSPIGTAEGQEQEPEEGADGAEASGMSFSAGNVTVGFLEEDVSLPASATEGLAMADLER